MSTPILYGANAVNNHPLFEMIKKRKTPYYLTEGRVLAIDNKISNNDIFPATIVFKENIKFTFQRKNPRHGYFCFGLCRKDNHYANIFIDMKHRTITRTRNFGHGDIMGFDLPLMQECDELELSYDTNSIFLTINGMKHCVWNITCNEIGLHELKTICYMVDGTISIL